jgi:hypothetical protein
MAQKMVNVEAGSSFESRGIFVGNVQGLIDESNEKPEEQNEEQDDDDKEDKENKSTTGSQPWFDKERVTSSAHNAAKEALDKFENDVTKIYDNATSLMQVLPHRATCNVMHCQVVGWLA